MEKDGSCSLAGQDVSLPPLPSLLFRSLFHFSMPGSKHLDKRNLFFPTKYRLFSFPQPHRWFTGVVQFILRNRGYTSLTQPSLANFSQRPKEIATNNLQRQACSLVTHSRIICGIWDLQCFSKLAHSFYSKLRFQLILV